MAVDIRTIESNLDVDRDRGGRVLSGFGAPPQPDGTIVGRGKELFGYGYYKKAERFYQDGEKAGMPYEDNGWIRLEQDNPTARLMFIDAPENEGFDWTYLGKYGRFQPGQPFDLRTDQFRGLIECGGEHEFPVNQLIELGWHRRPPTYLGLTDYSRPMRGKKAQFPQLAELPAEDLVDVECSICHQKLRPAKFGGMEDLHRHETIYHARASSNHDMARTLAAEMGKAVEGLRNGGGGSDLADALLMLAEQNERLMRELANRSPNYDHQPPEGPETVPHSNPATSGPERSEAERPARRRE